jgi:hypothetical protein
LLPDADKGALDAGDLPVDALPLASQRRRIGSQRRGLSLGWVWLPGAIRSAAGWARLLTCQHLSDDRQSEPGLAQQQDPLQARQRRPVVVAVPVPPDP